MKRLALLLPLFLSLYLPLCLSQTENSPQPDLGDFSSQQLRDCYDDLKLCGARDESDINAELASRLPDLPTDELVLCFDDWTMCGLGEGQASGWPISDEIARRGDPHYLLVRYWKERKWTIRDGIEHVAYHFDSPEVTSFMRRIVSERVRDGEDRYWPVNYLAKKCDQVALKELASGRYRDQGSLQYQTSVELFGKCQYRPAIPYLVNSAVYDWSSNIIIAADHSLHALYPDGPKDFSKLNEMQKYFCNRARQDGFKVKCSKHKDD
jgi:hypothetical protein